MLLIMLSVPLAQLDRATAFLQLIEYQLNRSALKEILDVEVP